MMNRQPKIPLIAQVTNWFDKTFQFGFYGVIVFLLKINVVKSITPSSILAKNKVYKETIRKREQQRKHAKRTQLNQLKGTKRKQKLRREIEDGVADYYSKSEEIKQFFNNLNMEEIKPSELKSKKRGFFSQHFEELILFDLFNQLGTTKINAVEIGAGHNGGNILSCMLYFSGSCLFLDGDKPLIDHLKKTIDAQEAEIDAIFETEFITKENAISLCSAIEGELDYLGVDIDGNDYHILRELLPLKPKVVVVEYNPFFGEERKLTVKYDPHFDRKSKEFKKFNAFGIAKFEKTQPKGIYGASLSAIKSLLVTHEYKYLGCINGSNNALAIRSDLAPQYQPKENFLVNFSFPQKRGQKELLEKFNAMDDEEFVSRFVDYIEQVD